MTTELLLLLLPLLTKMMIDLSEESEAPVDISWWLEEAQFTLPHTD